MAKNISYYEKRFEDNPKGAIRGWIFWLIGIIILCSAIFWVIDLVTTPAQSAKGVIKKTLNPDNVLQNYEWFKQQYNDYLAINGKIAQADSSVADFKRDAGDRSKWTFDDKQEYSRLNSIDAGLRYQRADIVATYNARSKMLDRNLFKSNDLPPELMVQ